MNWAEAIRLRLVLVLRPVRFSVTALPCVTKEIISSLPLSKFRLRFLPNFSLDIPAGIAGIFSDNQNL
jgi:hypothetical protein